MSISNSAALLRLWLACLGMFCVSALGCGYNAVIQQDEGVKAAWAEVENQYQRRADLVPNLVSVVKGAAAFEKETLDAVVTARSKVGSLQVDASTIDDPEKLKRFEQAQGELSSSLSRLLVVSENYPDLKAVGAFRDLQAQLEGTENRITVARRRFIEAVQAYNQTVLSFPTSIGAGMRGKAVRPTFTATTPGADKAPQVTF
jgi:LemA protein